MTKKRQIKGFWWFPDRTEFRCSGDLNLDEDATLEIYFERNSPVAGVPARNAVIHGQDENGKPITLLFVDSPEGGAWHTRRTFWAGYALIGIHVPSLDKFLANNLRVQMQQLYGWAGLSGFQSDPGSALNPIVIKYQHPTDLVFPLNGDMTLELGIASHASNRTQMQSVDEDAWFSFKSQAGLSLQKCRDLMVAFRHLLHFASLEPVYPTLMQALINDYGLKSKEQFFPHEIEVWSAIFHEPKTLEPIPDKWLFRFEDIKGRLPGFMSDWLDYVEKYDEALNCYSSTVYHRLPDTMIHLALTQGLDSYHGEKHNSHEHRVGFKQKIEQLVTPHATALGISDTADFAERVRTTRNYYTHHNPEDWDTGLVAEKADLFRMDERLTLLFQMCVLTDIQIPPDRFPRLNRQIAAHVTDFF